MSIDRATLINKLNLVLDTCYVFGSYTVDDVLSTAMSTCVLDQTNLVTVATADDLPTLELYDSPDALLYFLTNLGIYVISSNKRWITLDGRLIRDDSGRLPTYAWAWGCNDDGQLGDQTATDRSSPVIISGGFADWCEISAGSSHSLAVRTDGTAWAWGSNGQGRLGDGSVTNRTSPVSVVGGFADWCEISASDSHSLAVRTDGTAWAWGFNGNGRLGDLTVTARSSPVSVVGGFADWCEISAGGNHSLAVRTDGTAWSWGFNGDGQLGDGSVTNQSSPVSVVGEFADWCEISAGGNHSLAVRTDGTAWAWGRNSSGQLGDGTTTARSSPVSVLGGFGDWCEISAGSFHSLAVRTDGTAWAWGSNGQGRLGDGSVTNRSSPVSVMGGFGDWCEISAGLAHSLAVKTDGSAWAWGSNSNGQLGDQTTTNRTSPVSVVGGFSDWCQISAGFCHSLALRVIS
jgi:alpha-tubulin suppressor-like RCC1 family protein